VYVRSEFQRVKNAEEDGVIEKARGEDQVRDRAPSGASDFEAPTSRVFDFKQIAITEGGAS
jgi:hypothetical protein